MLPFLVTLPRNGPPRFISLLYTNFWGSQWSSSCSAGALSVWWMMIEEQSYFHVAVAEPVQAAWLGASGTSFGPCGKGRGEHTGKWLGGAESSSYLGRGAAPWQPRVEQVLLSDPSWREGQPGLEELSHDQKPGGCRVLQRTSSVLLQQVVCCVWNSDLFLLSYCSA